MPSSFECENLEVRSGITFFWPFGHETIIVGGSNTDFKGKRAKDVVMLVPMGEAMGLGERVQIQEWD